MDYSQSFGRSVFGVIGVASGGNGGRCLYKLDRGGYCSGGNVAENVVASGAEAEVTAAGGGRN